MTEETIQGGTITSASAEVFKDEFIITAARILSFVLPNVDHAPRYPEQVKLYEFRIYTSPQSGESYHFRLIFFVECKIVFDDKFELEASIQSEIEFRVTNSRVSSEEFAMKNLSVDTLKTMLEIGYSTTRGLLLSKATGSLLEDAVLPIVSPDTLMFDKPKQSSGEAINNNDSQIYNKPKRKPKSEK